MDRFNRYRGADGRWKVDVKRRGYELIRQPLLNKSSAFPPDERRALGLEGLLPSHHNSIEMQVKRIHASISARQDDLEKFVSLAALQDRNETLYFRLLRDHLEEYMPIVYTPTVGRATRNFSHVFRRARGIWITPDFRGRIAQVLRAGAQQEGVRLLVVTDNESILGIGDQGAGGMAISVGKLALYCAGGGVHPGRTLPVSIDVGTNNDTLLNDELYLGWPQRRLRGRLYDELIAEFVAAVKEVFPGAIVQWEDFRKDNALNILDRYRDQLPSFNDDIQGTGAVALAGLLSSQRLSGIAACDQRIVIHGAGAAGLGIARQLRAGLVAAGVSDIDAHAAIAVLDSRGLLVDDRDLRDAYKSEMAWSSQRATDIGLGAVERRNLEDVVRAFKPTVLIGSSGQPGSFTETIVREMAQHTQRPLILPFSNPTDFAEAVPEDLYRWTEGRCLVATGSPFPAVEYGGRRFRVGQGNNVFIFPGLGLGALLCNARHISDAMISAAANALAQSVHDDELQSGLLYPAVNRLRNVSASVTAAVMRQAVAEDACLAIGDDSIEALIESQFWEPDYPDYVAV